MNIVNRITRAAIIDIEILRALRNVAERILLISLLDYKPVKVIEKLIKHYILASDMRLEKCRSQAYIFITLIPFIISFISLILLSESAATFVLIVFTQI